MVVRSIWLPCALVALVAALAFPAAADETWVYHYDPDSSPHDPGKFKAVVNAFFQSIDVDLRFQPFRARVDLERQLRERPPRYLLVSADFLEHHGKRLGLRPLLVPTRRGKDTFHKVLVTRQVGLEQIQLAGRSLAAVGLASEAAFDSHLGPLKVSARELRVVSVSKDVDALLALALGQVDVALVRPESIERVAKVNPLAVEGLRTLYRTRPLRLPRLCRVGEPVGPPSAKLVAGLQAAMSSRIGRRAMRILGFDGWLTVKGDSAP